MSKIMKLLMKSAALFLLFALILSKGCVVNLSRGSPEGSAQSRTDLSDKQFDAALHQKNSKTAVSSGDRSQSEDQQGNKKADQLNLPSIQLTLPIAQTTADMTHFACKYQPEILGQGNYVLISHNYWNTFGKLGRLNRGDPIRVTEDGKEIVFHVVNTQVIDCHETQVLGPTKESQVTLITCFGQAGTEKRLVITGEERKSVK